MTCAAPAKTARGAEHAQDVGDIAGRGDGETDRGDCADDGVEPQQRA